MKIRAAHKILRKVNGGGGYTARAPGYRYGTAVCALETVAVRTGRFARRHGLDRQCFFGDNAEFYDQARRLLRG